MSLYSDTTGPWAVYELTDQEGRVIYHARPESMGLPGVTNWLVLHKGLTASVAERIAERRNGEQEKANA